MEYLPPARVALHSYGLVATQTGGKLKLSDALAFLESAQVCCQAVRVPLEDPGAAAVQPVLKAWGFRLTAIIPPKLVYQGRQAERHPAFALWGKPRPDLLMEPPFYADQPPANEDEAVVLDYRRGLTFERSSPKSGTANSSTNW